jgi:hypothetical protein
MSKQVTRQQQRQEKRREEQRRREEERLRAAKAKRRFTVGAIFGSVLIVAIAISAYFFFIAPGSNAQGQTSASSNPVNALDPPVDNIPCDQGEQTAVHYHAHLTLYVNGSQVQLPAQVGIASNGSCFYWLHTHDTTGVIHIESPSNRDFTLGNFFRIWAEQFPQLNYRPELDTSNGWQVYLDGKPYNGDFHNLVLKSHMVITLAYNSPGIQPDTTFDWVKAGLSQ